MRSLRVQLAVCVALAAAVRIAAYDVGPVQRADVGLLGDAALPWGWFYRLAMSVVATFDPLPYALLLAAVLAIAVAGGRARAGVVGVGMMLAAAVTSQVLKQLLAAPRPQAPNTYVPDGAWPSGHTTAAAALAIALVLITPPGRRRPVAIFGVALTAVIGSALVALGSHYPSDVAGGVLTAGAWGLVAWRVARGRSRRAVP